MKRIAVYIAGHFRNLNETWKQYSSIFRSTDQYTVDFFFVIWNVRDTSGNIPVVKEDILQLCPTAKLIKFLDSSYEVPPSHSNCTPNIVKQFYGIYSCFQEVPNDYDLYIRLRSDLYFFTTDFLPALAQSDANLHLVDNVWFNHPNYPLSNRFNDIFWVADYKTSKYIADIYLVLPKLFTKKANYPERILAIYLKNIPFQITISHFFCELNVDRRTRGAEMWYEESRVMTERRRKLEQEQAQKVNPD
jgi:hypothetical protein